MRRVLYYICPRNEWDAARARSELVSASLEHEGFVHCSTASQHAETANAVFAGRTDLVLVMIDSARLTKDVRYEGGYPHVYGPIAIDAVFDVDSFEPDTDGRFLLHHETTGFSNQEEATLSDVAQRAHKAMREFPAPWAVAGGWGLDLFLERSTRPHADLEIAIFRTDLPAFFNQIRGWDARLVSTDGTFEPWLGQPVDRRIHQIWTRSGDGRAETWQEFAADPTMLDVLIEESSGDDWVFRRDESVRAPLGNYAIQGAFETPIVRPDIALLYKAKGTRWKDQRDFDEVLPRLGPEGRHWLRTALETVHPHHAWAERLENDPDS